MLYYNIKISLRLQHIEIGLSEAKKRQRQKTPFSASAMITPLEEVEQISVRQ